MNITEDGSAPRGTDYDGVLVMVGVLVMGGGGTGYEVATVFNGRVGQDDRV